MQMNTERSVDGTIIVTPQNEGDQSALVVICHGLGDTSEGFADVAEVCIVKQN
jgi:alpha-beta hydrolase superfamily lysophospholipase